MKIAILIGISEYQKLTPLPPCKNDLKLIENLIKRSKKFDKIFSISDNTFYINVREIILELENFQSNEVEEIFFYYSGHGYFNDNEFYYSCTDSDIDSIQGTFIINSELDKLIRKLNPAVTIKLVDACNAGVRYVKNPDPLELNLIEKYLTDSKGIFNSCYFMFSSDVDQCSIADDKLSHFTRSFLRAIKNHSSSKIKYGEIMTSIASDFELSEQTPIFVTQGNFNDIFCEISPEIKDLLKNNESLFLLNDLQVETEDINGTAELESKKLEDVYQLIQKVHNKDNSLGECIAQALKIAQKYDDDDLADFCKNELIGWDDGRKPKDDRFEYRVKEFTCSFNEMNPDHIAWAGDIHRMLTFMERDPNKYLKLKIFTTQPISYIEKDEYKYAENKLIVLKMPAKRFLPKYDGPIETIYCYAKADIYKDLAESIRTILTKKLFNLLGAPD